ncbi:cold-shock DNA-binding protein family [Pedobacter rhizosphaerae]|uniref:Cold-shock DNA-binding protein family n=2 Tax=Pedobacter rhizosphaerae TaxID=390241 RepID=A0A1H9W397_9SPHI|nr:cold-shock DNA-binding protein family [Pedobacter rhizosphaerae]
MPKGKVKWYNAERGFGFIAPEDGTEVLFADSEKFLNELQELQVGSVVNYKVLNHKKGKEATDIQLY